MRIQVDIKIHLHAFKTKQINFTSVEHKIIYHVLFLKKYV